MVGCSYSFKDSICVHVLHFDPSLLHLFKSLSPENKKRLRRSSSKACNSVNLMNMVLHSLEYSI